MNSLVPLLSLVVVSFKTSFEYWFSGFSPMGGYMNCSYIYIILHGRLTVGETRGRVNSLYCGIVWLNAVRKRYHVRIVNYLTLGFGSDLKTRGQATTFMKDTDNR